MSGSSAHLMSRESEVLDLLLMGLADKEVAKTLRISDKTVRTHIANAMLKLGVANRCQLGHRLAQGDAGESGSRAVGQSGSPAVGQ